MKTKQQPIIAITESDVGNQQLIAIILSRIGCKTIIKTTAAELLEYLKNTAVTPDHLLLNARDDVFPLVNYARSKNLSIPMTATTTTPFATEHQKLKKIGFTKVLLKPYAPEELLKCAFSIPVEGNCAA